MQVWRNISDWQCYRTATDVSSSMGLVPTMGCLHQGHGALLRQARAGNKVVVLSIFVNPTQFNESNDYEQYPQTIEQDLAYAKELGVDHVLLPSVDEMYPNGPCFSVDSTHPMALEMEGAARPGHFSGMLTVVMKLLQLVRPDRAYFGEKDFQQLYLIETMAQEFFLPTTIVAVATMREASGLPCSSRNRRLSDEQRILLDKVYSFLPSVTKEGVNDARNKLEQWGVVVEYICYQHNCIFMAFRVGSVRLIDHFVPGVVV